MIPNHHLIDIEKHMPLLQQNEQFIPRHELEVELMYIKKGLSRNEKKLDQLLLK